ncbi:hypothetical protein NN561_017335 [Cricetulus griseus]
MGDQPKPREARLRLGHGWLELEPHRTTAHEPLPKRSCPCLSGVPSWLSLGDHRATLGHSGQERASGPVTVAVQRIRCLEPRICSIQVSVLR